MQPVLKARNASFDTQGSLQLPLVFIGARLEPNGSLDCSRTPQPAKDAKFAFGSTYSRNEIMLNYAWASSQAGAAVLRLDQITTGMFHLLSQASEPPEIFCDRQVLNIVSSFASVAELYSLDTINGRLLSRTAQIFGSGPFKNVRMQRLHSIKPADETSQGKRFSVHGGIADLSTPLHTPFMAAGKELVSKLGSQGFLYIPRPVDENLIEKINTGNFSFNRDANTISIIDRDQTHTLDLQKITKDFAVSFIAVDQHGTELNTADLKRQEDAEGAISDNISFEFRLSGHPDKSCFGLIVSPEGIPLPKELALDVLRVDVFRKAGFNNRPSIMNAALFGDGYFKMNAEHTVSRSVAHEALFKIMADLTEYGFDPMSLTIEHEGQDIPAFEVVAKKTSSLELKNACLYLNLAAQATHPLVKIEGQPSPEAAYGEGKPNLTGREGRPVRYRLPIAVEVNSIVAIADFLRWHPAQAVQAPSTYDPHTDHILYQGDLPTPDMSSAPEKATKIFEKIIHLSQNISIENFGRAHPECNDLLMLLREELQLDDLVKFAADDLISLGNLNTEKFEALDHKIKDGIVALSKIDTIFQNTPGLESKSMRSKGIGAVTDAVMEHLLPSLKPQKKFALRPVLTNAGAIYAERLTTSHDPMKFDLTKPGEIYALEKQAYEASILNWSPYNN